MRRFIFEVFCFFLFFVLIKAIKAIICCFIVLKLIILPFRPIEDWLPKIHHDAVMKKLSTLGMKLFCTIYLFNYFRLELHKHIECVELKNTGSFSKIKASSFIQLTNTNKHVEVSFMTGVLVT